MYLKDEEKSREEPGERHLDSVIMTGPLWVDARGRQVDIKKSKPAQPHDI